jgi:hypothetical protein
MQIQPTEKSTSVSANAIRQAAFVERNKALGRKRIHFWVAEEKARLVRAMLLKNRL